MFKYCINHRDIALRFSTSELDWQGALLHQLAHNCGMKRHHDTYIALRCHYLIYKRKFGTCQLLHHLVAFKEINFLLRSSCEKKILEIKAGKTQSCLTSKFKRIVSSLKTYYATHKNVKMNDTYTLMEFYVNHSKEYGTVDTLEAYQCAQKLHSFHELCEYDSKTVESLTRLNQVRPASSNVNMTSQKGKSSARGSNVHTFIERKKQIFGEGE